MAKKKSRKRTTTRQRGMTPEDLSRIVSVATPQVSPDGSRMVFVRKHIGDRNNSVANLWMAATDGTAPWQFTSGGKDGMPRWCSCGGKLAFVSRRQDDQPQIHIMDTAGGEARQLTSLPPGTIREIAWSPDGSMIAMAWRETAHERTKAGAKEREEKGLSEPPWEIDDVWYRLDGDGYFGDKRFALYIVDVATGAHRLLFDKDTAGFFDFDWSPDSKSLAVTTNTDKRALFNAWNSHIEVINAKTGKRTTVRGLPDGPKLTPRWSPDGRTLAYAGRADRLDSEYSTENLELFVCDPAKGNTRSLTAKTDFCLLAAALSDTAEVAFAPTYTWTSDSKHLLVKLGWEGQSHIHMVSRRGGALVQLTSGTFDYDLGNVSTTGNAIAMTRSTHTALPEVYAGRLEGDAIRTVRVSGFNDALLRECKVSRPLTHWVKTDDGTRCQVWVMKPPQLSKDSKKKCPAVLQIHGGPHAQYGVGFFHEFQVLAAAGHVVVFSNPRGSKGYGREHCAAIRGSWGKADWVDIQAVTKFMQAHPNIDAKRMGVMGGSYGGYMTNWVIGHTNEFAGAITDRCVSNVVSASGNADFIWKEDGYWEGNFWSNPEARWEASPIRLFGNVCTPTLIIHSEGDLRCNVEQSEQVFVALKTRNIPTRFVRYPRTTSHGMSRSGPTDMRLHRLHEILNWWSKYLAPKKPSRKMSR